MAKVTYSPIISDVRCRLGNMVFSKWKGTSYLKTYAKPGDPKSVGQVEVRNAFTRLTKNWKEVNGILHRSWKAYVKGKNMTGYNAFIGANSARQRNGEPLELFKPMGEAMLSGFMAAKGPGTGEITCTFSMPANSTGKHLTLFIQKAENGKAEGVILRHDMGAVTDTQTVITGLETGAQYFVYGIVTGSKYDESETVSASSSAMAEAA